MIRPPWEKYDRAKRSEGEAISDSERSLEKTEDVKAEIKDVKLGISLCIWFVSIGMFGGSIFLYDAYDAYNAPSRIEFDSLQELTGIVQSLYKKRVGGRGGSIESMMALKMRSGEQVVIHYWVASESLMASLVGEEVTVWVRQSYMYFGFVPDTPYLYRMRHKNNLVIDHIEKGYIQRGSSVMVINMLFAIFFYVCALLPGIKICCGVNKRMKENKRIKELGGEHVSK